MAPAAKRRKTALSGVEEVSWNPSARHEYLTGFHKRKQQRIQHAQKIAVERDRVQRIADRKQIREQRREDLEQHVQQVNAALRKADPAHDESDDDRQDAGDTSDAWQGFDDVDDGAGKSKDSSGREDEYIDEDKYTTVTIEQMVAPDDNEAESATRNQRRPSATGNRQVFATKKSGQAKRKPARFRYESKADRRKRRFIEGIRNAKMAEARRLRS